MSGTNALSVHHTNAAQLSAWDGDEGAYWAAHADHFDRAVAPHHRRLLDAAAIGVGEHVLDIGCGTGQTTLDAARAATAGAALGVDLSSAMLACARRRAVEHGIENASFEQVDAQIHPFEPAAFDVAISRTGAMFFGDLVAAFSNIGRALRPASRIALLTWQPLARNEWIRELSGALAAGRDRPAPPPDAPGPFALADPGRVDQVLTTAGFTEVELEAVDEPMWFGTDADDAHRFVLGQLGWMLDGLDAAGRGRALDALHATVAAHSTADGVLYESGAWLIRATHH